MVIFLSYGHDEYDKFAYKLKRDLEEHGFQVWMDISNIRGTADWQNSVENGINASDWFIIVMTEHSCRRPNGVCLDEVSYARFLGKNIAPIMVQYVKPPLCIARIQYIDMENFFNPKEISFDEEAYQRKFRQLLDVMHGVEEISREGEYELLKNRLIPLDNDIYYEHFRSNFYGRVKLFSYYQDWMMSDSKLLWIIGDAGVGKTAFVAKLAENSAEIKAVHFCRYNDSDRANPKRAIMSLAFYLSTQITEYKDFLMNLQDLDKLQEKSVGRLFDYLLLEPLNKVHRDVSKTVLIIDALDEASVFDRNELAEIIANKCNMLPAWVKIIITSRDEPLLRRKLSRFRPLEFSDSRFIDNWGDIRGYLEMRLISHLVGNKHKEMILDHITKKSDGNFLYAKTVASDILDGILSVEEYNLFPEGLTGVYTSYFDRLLKHSELDYGRDIRPVLEVLCAEYGPIRSADMIKILNIDEYDYDDIKETLAQMFPEKEHTIEPVHKSIIDWLLDREKSGKLRVSSSKGHLRLARFCSDMLDDHNESEYVIKYSVRHMISAKMYDNAVALLNKREFQDKRILTIGMDSAIREYLYEISLLLADGVEIENAIYRGNTFCYYFSLYRNFFFDSGLYFSLQRNNFDSVLSSDYNNNDVNFNIGIASYLYITERFEQAIALINDLLLYPNRIGFAVSAELSNLIALCYRKCVNFDLARKHFVTSLEYYDMAGANHSKYGPLLNLGKVSYHELKWEDANDWNNQAYKCLMESYKMTENADQRIAMELFVAEYHRLIAECAIWKMDIETAEENLTSAEMIYKRLVNRDRYYVRYIYTSAFLKVLKQEANLCLDLCESALELANSKYDKSQILFYMGIAHLQNGESNKCIECAVSGIDLTAHIGAWLEEEELSLLRNLADCSCKSRHSSRYEDNAYIRRWSEYVNKFLKGVTQK